MDVASSITTGSLIVVRGPNFEKREKVIFAMVAYISWFVPSKFGSFLVYERPFRGRGFLCDGETFVDDGVEPWSLDAQG